MKTYKLMFVNVTALDFDSNSCARTKKVCSSLEMQYSETDWFFKQ